MISLPQGTGVRALNMEKMIWDESLSITATNVSSQCNNLYSNITALGASYRNVLESMGTDARVNVSENANNILVGETMHIVEDWNSADDAALESFEAWLLECDRYTFATDCDGLQDPSSCRNCLQLIWSKSRYVGCGLTVCPSISNVADLDVDIYNSVLFVCHWYWGADLFAFSGDTNWRLPFLPSFVDDFCSESPFDSAGCNDTERSGCDNGLCDGCPR